MIRAALLVAAVVVAVLLLVRFYRLGAQSARLEPAPQRRGRMSDCPRAPNCVASRASDPARRVEPLRVGGQSEEALERIREVVEGMPRTRIALAGNGYLHAECTSALFRFVDDLELLVDPDAGVVHVRSASRVGHSDLGANRRRVERLRRSLAGPG